MLHAYYVLWCVSVLAHIHSCSTLFIMIMIMKLQVTVKAVIKKHDMLFSTFIFMLLDFKRKKLNLPFVNFSPYSFQLLQNSF